MLDQAAEAIRECESRLRHLMAQASASGLYEEVATLMSWAKSIAAIVDSDDQPDLATIPETGTAAYDVPAQPVAVRRKSSKTKRPQYPQFSRFRNELLKTGWSKKKKKEYQHRASRQVVYLLCSHLEEFKGKDFTSEEFLPLVGEDGFEVPSYQAYLCLAWFRETGMIAKNGRHGYFVEKNINLKAALEQQWKLLPEQRQ